MATDWREMPCLEWHGQRTLQGYGVIWTRRVNGKQGRVYAHRKTWEECFGDVLTSSDVIAHHCDNPPCRQPLHLFKTTKMGNTLDMLQKERTGRIKFGAYAVRDIRHRRGVTSGVDLAAEYGVNPTAISKIQLHKNWRHIS